MNRARSLRKGALTRVMKKQRIAVCSYMAACLIPLLGAACFGQSIQPLIVEYTGKADGKFELTNNTLTPMAVVLEPKSFGIDANGKGIYRPLDANIHLELSAMSLRLEPKQTYYVFYKVNADQLPAWFTVYAVFTPIQKTQGIKLRIMLPHTVYLYQKKSLDKEAIDVKQVTYLPQKNLIVCDLENLSPSLVRVQELRAVGGKQAVPGDGFPLLPHSPRHLEIPWTQTTPPSYLLLHFPRFDLKEPISVKEQ
jgi:hypothetical protein